MYTHSIWNIELLHKTTQQKQHLTFGEVTLGDGSSYLIDKYFIYFPSYTDGIATT